MGIVLKGTVSAKELDWLNRKIEDLPEGEYQFYLLDKKKRRTLPQLRFYWGVIMKEVENYTGYDKGRLHSLMKQMFGKHVSEEIGGYLVQTIVAFSGEEAFTKSEASEFIQKVIQFWTEKGIIFKLEGDLTTDEYVEAYDTLGED